MTQTTRDPGQIHENLYQHFKIINQNKQELAEEFLNNECPFKPKINKIELTKYK